NRQTELRTKIRRKDETAAVGGGVPRPRSSARRGSEELRALHHRESGTRGAGQVPARFFAQWIGQMDDAGTCRQLRVMVDVPGPPAPGFGARRNPAHVRATVRGAGSAMRTRSIASPTRPCRV